MTRGQEVRDELGSATYQSELKNTHSKRARVGGILLLVHVKRRSERGSSMMEMAAIIVEPGRKRGVEIQVILLDGEADVVEVIEHKLGAGDGGENGAIISSMKSCVRECRQGRRCWGR